MIPRILHYCWYGHGKIPAAMQMCMESWRRFCPDYEIKEWNEENTPMDIPWIRDAYMHQKYAFVADYMRFYVLSHFGGVYLDTDMLLVKSINDLLEHRAFLGMEDGVNANFALFGAESGSIICKECIAKYDSMEFDMVHPPIITSFLTPLLKSHGLINNDTTQILDDGLIVFCSKYFYPIHYTTKFEISDVWDYVNPETYAIHLWNKSWTDEFQLLESGNWKLGFSEARKRIKRTPFLPFAYWKKLIKYTGRYLGLWKR